MNAWETKIDEWIACHQEQLVADIVTLVKIKSVSQAGGPPETPFGSGCREALDVALSMGAQYGFATDCFEHMVGTIDMGMPGETIGFWGHLDVVPEGDGWDFEPYGAAVRDGLIIGRGAQDNKGQTLAVLYVMRCIQELGIPLKHNLRLYLGTNEECGMADVERYLSLHNPPPFNIIADSNYPVCYGEKGIITAQLVSDRPISGDILSLAGGSAPNVVPDTARAVLKITPRVQAALPALQKALKVENLGDSIALSAKGIAGHTAFPKNSKNAIFLLTKTLEESGALSPEDKEILRFLNEINSDYWGTALGVGSEDEDSGPLTCVGSILSLDKGIVSLTINIRYPVSGDAHWICGGIQAACAERKFSPTFERIDPAHSFPKEHPAVSILTDCYNRVMEDHKAPFVLSGGTYARKVKKAISFGMGFGEDTARYMEPHKALFRAGHGGAHGPDECTIVELLLKSIKIFILGLLELDTTNFAEQ